MVESYSIVWTRHIYLTHLAVDERLSCFHLLAVVMSIDMNIHIQTLECCIQFLWIYTWECSLQWVLVSSLIFPVDCELHEGRGRQTPTPGAGPANAWGADGTRLQHPESMSHSPSPTCPFVCTILWSRLYWQLDSFYLIISLLSSLWYVFRCPLILSWLRYPQHPLGTQVQFSFPPWHLLSLTYYRQHIYYIWHLIDNILSLFCSSHSLLSFFTKNAHAEDRGFQLFWSLLYPSV